MAFAAVGSFCDANSTSAGTTFVITPTATLNAGNLGVLSIGSDNINLSAAPDTYGPELSEIASVVDSVGNLWRKAVEVGQFGGAGGQITGSFWYCIPTTNLTTSDTITVTYLASVTSKAATGHEFTFGAGPISIEAYTHEISIASDFESLTLSSLPSREYLLLRLGAKENNSTAYTPSTNYTAFTHTNATANTGTAGTSAIARGEYRIATLTTDTTNPDSGVTNGATASAYIAIYEGDPYPVRCVGSSMPQGSTVGIDIIWPSGHQEFDIGVIVVETAGGEAPATPTGFSVAFDSPKDDGQGGAAGTRLSIFWRRATGSAMANVNFPDAGNHVIAGMVLIRGAMQVGDPFDVTAGNVQATADTSIEIPGDTTTVANTLVIAVVTIPTDAGTKEVTAFTNADLTHLREISYVQTSGANGGGFALAVGRKATAGAYGTTTATLVTSATQARWSGAIKPHAEIPGGHFLGTGGTGSRATTPDHASLDITGDIDLRFCAFFYDPAGHFKMVITKGDVTDDVTAAFYFGKGGSQPGDEYKLIFDWRPASQTETFIASNTGLVVSVPRWYRFTLDVDNGSSQKVGTFYYSDEAIDTDPATVTWTQYSQHTVGGVTNIQSSNDDLWLGDDFNEAGEEFDGRLYYAEVRNGIAGTIVANPDFRTDCQQDTSTQLTDDQGRVWTVNSPATWVSPLACPSVSSFIGLIIGSPPYVAP